MGGPVDFGISCSAKPMYQTSAWMYIAKPCVILKAPTQAGWLNHLYDTQSSMVNLLPPTWWFVPYEQWLLDGDYFPKFEALN